jgi:glycosyltransferase involved in cell wall biosynthesis
VTVVTRPGGEVAPACAAAGIRLLELPLAHSFDLVSALAVRRLLRDHAVDVVHVHKGRAHAVALLAASGFSRLPVVVVNRGVSFPLDRWNRLKYRHPRVGAVVCVAEAVRAALLASGRLHPERVVTIPAGTDCDRFDPARVDRDLVRQELGLGPDHLLVGQVSVRDWKGWRELLRAFAEVTPAWPSARLLLVGCEGAADRQRVHGAARSHGVEEALLTLPFRRDMPEVLAACDVVVDASWAGTGITGTVREAMAMAKGVVATDCAGNRELVSDGATGLVVPPRDVPGLAAALARLLPDAELRHRFGRAARERVVLSFSSRLRLDRLEALYQRLVDERSGRK